MPLALLALFVGFLLINAGIRNEHPWAGIVQAFGGSPPGAPGISPGQADSIDPGTGGVATGTYGPPSAPGSGPTKPIKRVLAFVTKLPGVHIGAVCGPGSVAGSQHPMCNAVDFSCDSRGQLVAAFHACLVAAKSRAIPASEVIGPGGPSGGKGLIATASQGWKLRPYTGPNSHQGHVHVSGSPLL